MKEDIRRAIVDLVLPEIKKLEAGQKELKTGQEGLKEALERIEKRLEKMERRIDTMTDISSLIQTLTLTILRNITEKELEKEKEPA
ncbi:MAG: hypothetical protein DRI91_06975 [Aquificota bacterium]|nr:MAG: hypothetical protein DRI91_06975 [Aquificota bacterium]